MFCGSLQGAAHLCVAVNMCMISGLDHVGPICAVSIGLGVRVLVPHSLLRKRSENADRCARESASLLQSLHLQLSSPMP